MRPARLTRHLIGLKIGDILGELAVHVGLGDSSMRMTSGSIKGIWLWLCMHNRLCT